MAESDVYVGYITSGREEYKFHTTLVGVGRDKEALLKKIYCELIEQQRLFNCLWDDLGPDSLNDIDDHTVVDPAIWDIKDFKKRYAKCLTKKDFITEFKEDLADIPNPLRYEDSYYEEGWTYTIEKKEFR
jgi:hypothetical protein